MLVLAVETTGPMSSVSLNRDGKISEIKNDDNYSHLQQLMPMVSELLDKENVKAESIDAIAVSMGPGSFTGIRIGMASVKGLALVWNKPVVEVPTLAAFAYRTYDWIENKNVLICPVLDAKMHQVYAAAYKPFCDEALVPAGAYNIEEYLELLKSAAKDFSEVVFFGDGVSVYKDALDNCGLKLQYAPDSDKYQKSSGVAILGAELFAKNKYTDCYECKPEYFRLPEAERKLKEKQNADSSSKS